MRFRSVLVVVSFCLILGTSAAFSAEIPSRGLLEARELPGILGHLEAFLKVVWANLGSDIDPLGRTSPGTTGEDPATPSGDDAGHIDPWGSPGR
jgi:hypothetical protein